MEKKTGPKLFKGTSKYRELSQESWSSEHLEQMPRKLVKETFSRDTHLQHSESQEHSQNSQIKQVRAEIGNVKVTVNAKDDKSSAVGNNFLEDSQNSLPSGECEMDKGEANVSFDDSDGQCLAMASEFQELSPNSRV